MVKTPHLQTTQTELLKVNVDHITVHKADYMLVMKVIILLKTTSQTIEKVVSSHITESYI